MRAQNISGTEFNELNRRLLCSVLWEFKVCSSSGKTTSESMTQSIVFSNPFQRCSEIGLNKQLLNGE